VKHSQMKRRYVSFLVLSAASAWLAPGCEALRTGHGSVKSPPGPVPVRAFSMGRPDVVLLVTGGTCGHMELCNCIGPMPGGLARRNGLVLSYRAAFERTFLLDSGDVFWVDSADIRNHFVIRGYRRIGYDAVVLAHHEWAAYPKHLPRILADSPACYLSTTVAPAEPPPGWPAQRVVLRDWGDIKLAVVSDLKRETMLFFPEGALDRLKFSPPRELIALVARLKREGYVVVVAAPMDAESVEATAAALDADLIVRGHTMRSNPKITRVAGKPIVKIGGQETVGVVAMKITGGRITDLQLRLELVDTRWPMDRRLIDTYQAYAHAAMRQELDKKRKKGPDYMPSAECGRCHQAQYRAWRKSRHAGAYRTLQRERRVGDPNCLMCHTTGFGTEKGFYTIRKTPKLAGVNCQNCHRFNDAQHQRGGKGVGFKFPPVNEDVCTTCHTPVTDPRFSYKLKLPKARCPKTAKP